MAKKATHARIIIYANSQAPHNYELAEVPAEVARDVALFDPEAGDQTLYIEYETDLGQRKVRVFTDVMTIDIQFYNKEEQRQMAAEYQMEQAQRERKPSTPQHRVPPTGNNTTVH